ncbi:hypothetical protein K3N28_05410 [Glycomyces sp. TRM65418]|uniref:hypothetical protein n=1 Tax=Glycomyces sp. TRM65418 TaxID=2867006 RepID=UPI001CE66D91|nr:hypothetical protein [Glycomyces sp. TRM65418]MCC3762505.1 hypothetical protein [Glycomyces sp. TRM65418]QZD56548.1 hypothetical protein K3N28_05370 [Glycomyces sp. TRM65418]
MRRIALFSSALVLAVAGCSGASDDSGETPSGEQSQGNSSIPHDELTEPYDLQITPPEGFVEVDAAREPLLSEDQKTWTFALDGGDPDSQLNVTAYYLPEGTSPADYEAQVAMILDYEASMGNTIDTTNIYPALVHRQTGIHRYFKDAGGDNGALFMRNFFVFADQHVIQLTCQWRRNYAEVVKGCETLSQEFPFPAGWPAAVPAA